MKRYLVLFAAALLVGVALVPLARRPAPARSVTPAAAAPIVNVTVAITAHGLSPDAFAVPKGHRVVLTLENHDTRDHTIALAGYEDRLASGRLAEGASFHGEFVADRPGEDFAWLVDGRPAGRMSVQGSHLIEGHR
jgi:hypothetical protein